MTIPGAIRRNVFWTRDRLKNEGKLRAAYDQIIAVYSARNAGTERLVARRAVDGELQSADERAPLQPHIARHALREGAQHDERAAIIVFEHNKPPPVCKSIWREEASLCVISERGRISARF